MGRKLDILVPHWQETSEEMEPLLDSMAIQQGVDLGDVGVIIAFDGPDASELPFEEWRGKYPFPIDEVHPQKGGVSATRNAALDASNAELVMWCDADDCFYSVSGLFIIFEQYEIHHYDALVSAFFEQTKGPNGNLTFVPRENDSTFVHGKVYRRQFLVDERLRYNPDLTIHEDSYFQILARELAIANGPDKAIYCPYPFYLWKWRDASVCRHDPKYILKTFGNMIDSNDALVDEFVRRMRPELAARYCAHMVFESYYTMNKPEWRETENQEYRDKVERRFAKYFRKHRSKWDALTPNEKVQASQQVRQRNVYEGMLLEAVTVDQWLEHVSGLCESAA